MTNDEQTLTRKQAIDFLALDEKTFDNFLKYADEIKALPRKTRYYPFRFNQGELIKWKKSYDWRTVILNEEDYLLCLDFALAMHFRQYVTSDFGTGRQREFGQKITNWVKGQLGEIAVKKFFAKNFNTKIILDFDLHGDIVAQDIIGVSKSGKTREPKIGIGIKSSKPKSSYLVLGENEVQRHERKSDIYIFCRPDIPDDHLLRLAKEEVMEVVKDKPHYPSYKDILPSLEAIPCEIAGFCTIKELEKVTEIPNQKFDGNRYVKKTGFLHRDKKSWGKLISQL